MRIFNKRIKEKYIKVRNNYEKLRMNLEQALKILLEEEKISYLSVISRVKDVDSFYEKISRKNYDNPFVQIEDICGIRIICYYRSDIEKICEIINREFEVLESQDKEELLNHDQFGYRSHHFIIKVKEDWLKIPNYRDLKDLKAEIQVRTNLMHTWAEIEHKLEYKKDEDIPKEFKRRFSFLSAKLEEADEQFEALKNDINQYREGNVELLRLRSEEISNLKLNAENLCAFLNFNFPERGEMCIDDVGDLLNELHSYGVSIQMLGEFYNKTKPILLSMEEDENDTDDELLWNHEGIVRAILGLCLESYPKSGLPLDDVEEKYKEILKSGDI
ncbi:hypothetical protein P8F83_08040 [Clostridium intestinale]|nr:hypothetical protein [Clostridium intestinale]WRY53145.1 hypothetical protein P8F83_08040 [Clostridium intestinale]